LIISGLSSNWRENQPHQSAHDTSAGRNPLLDCSSVLICFELLFGVERAGYKPGKAGQIRTSNGSSELMPDEQICRPICVAGTPSIADITGSSESTGQAVVPATIFNNPK
jgi:hypothetical protein